jgi:Ribonuclease G/E
MTRKRSGKTLIQQLMKNCPCCNGTGTITSIQSECYAILTDLKIQLLSHKTTRSIELAVNKDVFNQLTSIEYNSILQLEKNFNCAITILEDKNFLLNQYKIKKT